MVDGDRLSYLINNFLKRRLQIVVLHENFYNLTTKTTSLYEAGVPEVIKVTKCPGALGETYPLYLVCVDTAACLIQLKNNTDYEELSRNQKHERIRGCLKNVEFWLKVEGISDVDINNSEDIFEKIDLIINRYSKRIDKLINIILFYKDILAGRHQKTPYYDVIMHCGDVEYHIEIAKVLGLTEKQAHYVAGVIADLPFKELCKFADTKNNTIGKLKKDVCKKLGLKPVGGEADNYRIKEFIQSLTDYHTLEAAKAIFQGDIEDKTKLARSYKRNKDIADVVREDPELLQIIEDKIAEKNRSPSSSQMRIENYQFFLDNPELFEEHNSKD